MSLTGYHAVSRRSGAGSRHDLQPRLELAERNQSKLRCEGDIGCEHHDFQDGHWVDG
jgi:hypothetical protein